MAACPSCGEKLSLMQVRNRFSCDYCQSQLKSNTTFSSITPLVIGGFIATPVSNWLFEKSLYVYGANLLIVFLFFLLVWPVLLKIEIVKGEELENHKPEK